MTDTQTTDIPCPLWRRLLALLYDVIAVLAIVMTVGLLCQLATHGQLITTGGSSVHIAWWYQPLQALVVAAYFVVSWTRGGQTLGMRPWHIRLTARDGGRVALWRAVTRALVGVAPWILLLLAPGFGWHAALWCTGVLWTLWVATALLDSRRRSVPDVVAATELRCIAPKV